MVTIAGRGGGAGRGGPGGAGGGGGGGFENNPKLFKLVEFLREHFERKEATGQSTHIIVFLHMNMRRKQKPNKTQVHMHHCVVYGVVIFGQIPVALVTQVAQMRGRVGRTASG